ncbi:hypothetical protein M514_02481 [Trichuris suis]|uniref:Uncharacterized protein n=1 Tax=Trichuris suis TaxID=68888 RepID=A0A085MHV8_9BILA|nr:hypothetical protein M513_02481 [Trichuris suis]KFD68153.1 hypothetical protein M514_02481 [Trichuris suis]
MRNLIWYTAGESLHGGQTKILGTPPPLKPIIPLDQAIKALAVSVRFPLPWLPLILIPLRTGHERPESYGIKVLLSKRDLLRKKKQLNHENLLSSTKKLHFQDSKNYEDESKTKKVKPQGTVKKPHVNHFEERRTPLA